MRAGPDTKLSTDEVKFPKMARVLALLALVALAAHAHAAAVRRDVCPAIYSLSSSWENGFVGSFHFTDSVGPFSFTFTFDDTVQIVNVWNGELTTSASGTAFTVTVAEGRNSFGFVASGDAATIVEQSVQDGASCTVDTVATPAPIACSEISYDVTAAWAEGSVVRITVGPNARNSVIAWDWNEDVTLNGQAWGATVLPTPLSSFAAAVGGTDVFGLMVTGSSAHTISNVHVNGVPCYGNIGGSGAGAP
eukprot:m.220041 g.220041  ORF g.220041 m.220041 type:complete len:249 (-) comp10299_c0_seq1:87-833(-)